MPETNDQANILSQLNTISNDIKSSHDSEIELLRSIDNALNGILQNGKTMSAADARASIPGGGQDASRYFRNASGMKKDFTKGFEEGMMEAFFGSDFKDQIKGSLDNLAKDLGVELTDLPSTLGKGLAKNLTDTFKQTGIGKEVFGGVDKLKQKGLDFLKDRYTQGVSDFMAKKGASMAGQVGTDMAAAGAEVASAAGGMAEAGAAASGAGTAMAGAGISAEAAAAGVAAASGPLIIGLVALAAAVYILGPAIEGAAKLVKAGAASAMRDTKSREKNLELAQQRYQADIETMVKYPFELLKQSAQEVYDAWDKNVRLINSTQGYNKSDLQNLMSAFAQRLRSEGLSSVISVADITESLASVLQSGLSGKVAEEFAYQAAKLGAAVPTQDFYRYASTYASIAANAIKNGQSEAAAIEYANKQMYSFASSVLYASRQLSGGFSTGLKDAQSIFEQSVRIAQASKTGDASKIAGVLTSVAAVTGAIAPDLASQIVDAVYNAAVGGNASQIVALRSLAGINASNTEFLKAFAENPQGVFANLFSKLGVMQNMSPNASMEVAEGLANIFGLSLDALARVDFNYLAQAISQMNVSNAAIEENLELLASGQTTTTAEQLKMQQINQYMIDEGLAYVLDNEAARSIQEHMWDEQIARELMEAEYAVSLRGAALEFLEGIRGTIERILGFLNPLSNVSKIYNLIKTAEESNAQDKDLKQMLELGKVGKGNALSLYQLTTRNQDLQLVSDLVTLLGGESAYSAAESARRSSVFRNNIAFSRKFSGSPLGLLYGLAGSGLDSLLSGGPSPSAVSGIGANSPTSTYRWATVGKSIAEGIVASQKGQPYTSLATSMSATSTSQARLTSNVERMLKTLDDYALQTNKSYEDWAATAKKYGISDLSSALQEAGYSEIDVQEQFANVQSQQGQIEQQRRLQKEEQFWDDITLVHFPEVKELVMITNDRLQQIFEGQQKFFGDSTFPDFVTAWTDYFVEHKTYYGTFGGNSPLREYNEIMAGVKSKGTDDKIVKLTQALTDNTANLLDPQAQTNALLAELVRIAMAIMNQNNSKITEDQLSSSLNALALGITK